MTKAHHYSNAAVMLDGKPIAAADLGMMSFREPAAQFVAPPNYTVSATFRGTGSLDAFLDLAPSKPAPVNVTMTWGILGPLTFPAWVADSTLRQTADGVSAEMGMVPDERALRRVVSMAVQRAIVNGERRDEIAFQVWSTDEPHVVGADGYSAVMSPPDVRRRAGKIVGRRYRGERKKQRAMRRLLRAAGILGGGR